MRLEARNLAAGYGHGFRIEDVDLVIEDRRITGLIGPNGAGKSTLLRALARLMKPQRGVVLLDGEVMHQQPGREVAKKLAFLGQMVDGVPDLTVEELVFRGRFPHQSLLHRDPAGDRQSVEWALAAMQMGAMRGRPLKQLSHGELRRAWTALALAQRPDILLLDEPTAFLDLPHQFELLDLLSDLKNHGVTVLLSMHDLWLTAVYCDRVIAMREGHVVGSGPTDEVLTTDLIRDVFGVEVALSDHPMLPGKKIALPYAKRAATNTPALPDPEPARPTENPKHTPSPH
jgi:ABC-type cobalamin/Fe3+-siderophores transport system ATPase subunit